MSELRTLDVSALPPGAFGSRAVTFWGTLGIVIIEEHGVRTGDRRVLLPGYALARVASTWRRGARSALGHGQYAGAPWRA